MNITLKPIDDTKREAFQRSAAEPMGLTRTGYFQPLDAELVE